MTSEAAKQPEKASDKMVFPEEQSVTTIKAIQVQNRSFSSVVKENGKPYERLNLKFVEPKMIDGKPLLELPETIIRSGMERWKNTIIGYVLGLNPSFREVVRFVNTRWAEIGKATVYSMGNGIFVFQMNSEDAKMEVMEKGPWSFSRRPLILRNWEPGMPVDKVVVNKLPIWVQFPHLPLELWNEEGLSLVASYIGTPLFADKATSEQSRLMYARVCIDVDMESVLHKELPIKYSATKIVNQKVTYEWIPEKCAKCKQFGHGDRECNATQKYVPKGLIDQDQGKKGTVVIPEIMEGEKVTIASSSKGETEWKRVGNRTLENSVQINAEEQRKQTPYTPHTDALRHAMISPNPFKSLTQIESNEEEGEIQIDDMKEDNGEWENRRDIQKSIENIKETIQSEEKDLRTPRGEFDVSETEEDTESLIADDGNLNARGNQPLENRVHSDSEGYNTVRRRRQTKRYSPPLIRGKRDRKAINNKNEAKLNDNDEVPEVVEKNDPNIIAVSECTYELIVASCKRKGIPPWPRKVYEKSIARVRKEGVNMLNIS